MTHPVDDDYSDLFPGEHTPSTATMPAVGDGPVSHRRPNPGFNHLLAAAVCGACGLIFLVTAGLILMSRDGGAVREHARPSTPASILPAVVVPAPTYKPSRTPKRPRKVAPAVPTAKRSSAKPTPMPTVSTSPMPSLATTPTPPPSVTPPVDPSPDPPTSPDPACVVSKDTPSCP